MKPAEFPSRYGIEYARKLLLPSRLPADFRRACAAFSGPIANGFVLGRTAPLCVAEVGDKVGRGLFAASSIAEGTALGEYAGVLTANWSALGRRHFDFNSYLLRYPFPTPFAIDARNCGNELRFANHSTTDWNATRAYALRGGVLRVIFVAARHLDRGEQILIDYGPEYWRGLGRKPLDLHSHPRGSVDAVPQST